MKKKIILILMASTFIVTLSCREKGCTDETALNYNSAAEKDDGTCIADPRQQYLGTYNVTDSSFGGASFISKKDYILKVTLSNSSDDAIYLNNWRNTGDNYEAYLSGSTFSAPDNGSPENGGISGTGSFEGNTITYTANNGSGSFETRGKGAK